MNKIKLTIILTLFISLYTAIYGQVTIGSGKDPMKGALLDLKEYDNNNGGDTAGKGMMLPRVKITTLEPKTAVALSASIGSTGNWDLLTHIGLTVYNINQCPAERLYEEIGPQVWNGSRWQLLKPLPAIIEATPAETSAPANAWGTKVVRHKAKPDPNDNTKNIYEEFYSADFGTAGRWMTTNLTAWKYDDLTHHSTDPSKDANVSTGTKRTLTDNPKISQASEFDAAYWCYPGGGSGGSDHQYLDKNSHLGLLYTWDAATAGKGDADGIGNIYNLVDGTANVEDNDDKQKEIQGICPNGWHLPSDYEWNVLEKYIYEHAEGYSSYTKAERESFNLTQPWGEIWESGDKDTEGKGMRPKNEPRFHGRAMKDQCKISEASTNPTNGLSNSIGNGGFNFLMSGEAANPTNTNWASSAFGHGVCWTSSSARNDNIGNVDPTYQDPRDKYLAWTRQINDNTSGVNRNIPQRWMMYSVRCKKDVAP